MYLALQAIAKLMSGAHNTVRLSSIGTDGINDGIMSNEVNFNLLRS